MTTESLLTEVRDALSDISGHLENISDGLWHNTANKFMERCAHVLTCDMFDQDKLNCIRIIYRQLVWPENSINEKENELLARIK